MRSFFKTVSAALIFALVTAGGLFAAELPVLKVGYAPGGGSILSLIAQDQNLYEKEGVKVELIPFVSSSDGLNALNSGKIDVGVSFGTGAPLTFITRGSDFAIIGGHLQGGHPVIALPARKDDFKSIQDYRGKTVATPRIYTADIVWRGALKRAGIDPNKDVNIVELRTPSAVLEAVKSGKVDVGIGTTQLIGKAKESGLVIVGWSNDFSPEHPCCRVVAKGKDLAQKPAVYVAYLKALLRAEKIKEEDSEVAVRVAQQSLGLDEHIAREFVLDPHQENHVDPNTHGVVQMWEDMKTFDYIQSDLDINKFINTQLYKEALDELVKSNPDDSFYAEAQARFARSNHTH